MGVSDGECGELKDGRRAERGVCAKRAGRWAVGKGRRSAWWR